MPVLEVLQLRVREGVSPSDPSIHSSLVEVRAVLSSRVVNTESHFYQCIEDTTLIYLLGIWPSLEAHNAFLSSAEKAEILSSQDKFLDFSWMLHIPISSMSEIPLDAPVLHVARLHVLDVERVTFLERILSSHRGKIGEATKPYNVVSEWRLDTEEARQEVITITGWKSMGAHMAFMKNTREHPDLHDREYASSRDRLDAMDVKLVQDMEAIGYVSP